MSLTQKLNRLSWDQVVVINSTMIMLTVALATQQFVTSPTTVTSKATPPLPTPPPNYPLESPQIHSPQPIFAKAGDAISILGNHFGDYQWQSSIILNQNSLSAPSISLWSNQRLNLTLPQNLSPNQIITLTLTVNQQNVSTPLALYDPEASPEFGLNPDQTQLYINRPQPNSYVILSTPSPVTPTDSAIALSTQNGLTVYQIPLESNSHFLLTSSTPITLTHLIPVINPHSQSIEVPYFISPTNPLFHQSQTLKSSLTSLDY